MPENQSESVEQLARGTKLGAYSILKTIGQGGFGITYLAERESDGAQVVIKENLPFQFCYRNAADSTIVSRPSSGDDFEWALKRFVEEAQLLAKLSHPSIVQVLQAFKALGTAYYVMPFVGGSSLDKVAKPTGRDLYLYVRNVLCKMLDALEYLHRHNLLHRDIKPGNILMTGDGNPVLIDFGTARALVSECSQTRIESPGYTPFEQVQSHGNTGAWTDLYALGATCYKVITGQTPPPSVDRIGSALDFQTLSQRASEFPEFPPTFLKSIDKAMEVFVHNRWQTAREWLDAVNAIPLLPMCEPNIDVENIALPAEKLPNTRPIPADTPSTGESAPTPSGSVRGRSVKLQTGKVQATAEPQEQPLSSLRNKRNSSCKKKLPLFLLPVFLLLGGGGVYWYFFMMHANDGGESVTVLEEQEPPQKMSPTPADKYDKAMRLLQEGKRDKGLRMLKAAADAGDPDALCELAEVSFKGKYNMPIDKIKAVRLYREAQRNGSGEAASVIRGILNKYR